MTGAPTFMAEHGEVLAEHEDQSPVDRSVTGHHAVAEHMLLPEAELGGPVRHERVHLHEGSRVEQQVQALAGGELAPGVLPLHPDGAAAQERFFAHPLESSEALLIGGQPWVPPADASLCKDTSMIVARRETPRARRHGPSGPNDAPRGAEGLRGISTEMVNNSARLWITRRPRPRRLE
jgi:hypothetical protein